MSTELQVVSRALPSPGDSLGAYLQAIGQFSILTAEEERRLAEDLYYHDKLDAAQELIFSHLRFVVHIARSYKGYGLPLADLVQEGNVGLMKAVRRFNPERGVRLVSFAVHWIKAEIHEYILRNWRMVKVATTKAQRKLFFNLRSAKKDLAWLNPDEAKAIADELGVSLKDVEIMEGRMSGHDVSFDPAESDDDESHYAPAAWLEDNRYDPAVQLEASDWQTDSEDRLLVALDGLDARSRDILNRRWLAEQKATLHELAAEYGVSAERIRQLEVAALKKLKGVMEA
ncbi:MAG TPA: RNA polymerase sigma factor RpoH [Pseudomonadales bacterium]|jgi:RNA polymerase sigma-32 factor